MSKPVSVILTVILSLLISTGSLGQAAQEREADQSVKLGVELVVMDVQVLQKQSGRPVGNLNTEDFIVYEDGIKQSVTHFSQDRLPLSVVLLLDVSRSLGPSKRQIRDGAIQAFQRADDPEQPPLMPGGAMVLRTSAFFAFHSEAESIPTRNRTPSDSSVAIGTPSR